MNNRLASPGRRPPGERGESTGNGSHLRSWMMSWTVGTFSSLQSSLERYFYSALERYFLSALKRYFEGELKGLIAPTRCLTGVGGFS